MLRPHICALTLILLVPGLTKASQTIQIDSPLDYQVFQRETATLGHITLRGKLPGDARLLQYRITIAGAAGYVCEGTLTAGAAGNGHSFDQNIPVPAGGWYQIELRAMDGQKVIADQTLAHVGVGEVFVVCGQSNSTNYGTPGQKALTKHVSAFDGSRWQLADDPQPGVQDHSTGGSFIPAFGDALYDKYHVPIGVASCGYGGTSVRQWLPPGASIARHPTTDAFVKTVAPGKWVCTGKLFDGLMQRINALGPHGFRAVLWHQGESDAGQARAGYPADRQITGDDYRRLLESVIRETRKRAGWDVPWFVAQATYHSEKDSSDAEFRSAQKRVCDDGLALSGPDTDALGAEYRNGVHFNDKGLKAHGKLWAQKVETMLPQ
ncbi:MAG TPA: sialate O-acetylesterase [Tepidisphaeraceae bacterium]|nr:sialate O-acetylesterase [Tepidisphaeraceae bacterium]